MIEGINFECDEIYHDLESGGATEVCKLTRGHVGKHGVFLAPEQKDLAVEKNAKFDAFMSNLMSDLVEDQKPVDSSTPPIFMHGG